jgi:FtsH-binding integral membrane protein
MPDPIKDATTTKRIYEMNEWTVQNKKDTLFVLSSLFIALSALLLITVLWRMGMSSGYTAAICAVPVVIIFVFIVINRSQYTNNIRDQRYWNRENRPKNASALQLALCPKMPHAEQAPQVAQ